MRTLPQFLTVEEAAAVVRIGRTAAYQLAARYEATDGREGLPVVRFGRLMRVPRTSLELWAGGPLDELPEESPSANESRELPPRRQSSLSSEPSSTQPSLPFAS
jgi:excisionase family DNA binding protein